MNVSANLHLSSLYLVLIKARHYSEPSLRYFKQVRSRSCDPLCATQINRTSSVKYGQEEALSGELGFQASDPKILVMVGG